MAKTPATVFACLKCGAQHSKWSGQCSECQAWGTLETEAFSASPDKTAELVAQAKPASPQAFSSLADQASVNRVSTRLPYLDRLLTQGLVPGSVTLLGGEPGIGKSTILAQLGLKLANEQQSVLYVTGEESPPQVLLRLKRLSAQVSPSFQFVDQTNADTIAATLEQQKPALTIVDSVQTLRLPGLPGEAGNPTQMRASAALITTIAKRHALPVILVGQVTKEGELAGPRLLEHLVDTVLMLEGERSQNFRVLRVVKHRFGSTDESAILEMTENGLEEVADPSALFLAHRAKAVSGTIVTGLLQGIRPLLIELQALVTPSGYGTPSRRTTGLDPNRLNLLLAVLSRRLGLSFSDQDVFVNAVGGIEARDPSIDLALALVLTSAKLDIPLPADLVAFGEVGLSGELRPVARLPLRLKEAARLGFKRALVPKDAKPISADPLDLHPCTTLLEAMQILELKRKAKEM